ncbi:MAG: sigma-70 family RNA polymerase sigma factor [Gammaproteobacteria bacterium]|nr:sigma-70 family RNA polymerase sigma factor [Gammaproteobacteria bacterium]
MLAYSKGDIAAFELLYHRHKAATYRYLLRQCAGQHEAEDLLQELWARVIKAKANYQTTALFTTWLYRIGHNLLADHHKKMTLTLVEPNDIIDLTASPEADYSEQQQKNNLKHCLNKLPAKQLEIFIIKQETTLTLANIASIVDASIEATKSRLRYAISSLKKCLGDQI